MGKRAFEGIVVGLLAVGVVVQTLMLLDLKRATVTRDELLAAKDNEARIALVRSIPLASVNGSVDVDGTVDVGMVLNAVDVNVSNTVDVSGSVSIE